MCFPYRTVFMRSLSRIEQNWFDTRDCQKWDLRGLKLRRLTQNQVNLHYDITEKLQIVIRNAYIGKHSPILVTNFYIIKFSIFH